MIFATFRNLANGRMEMLTFGFFFPPRAFEVYALLDRYYVTDRRDAALQAAQRQRQ